MSKKKKSVVGKPLPCRNPVAKHAHHFNRSVVFAEKTRYTRKTKHKGQDPVPMTIISVVIGTGFTPFFLERIVFQVNYSERICSEVNLSVY